jgi:FkbH-like protein
MEILKYTDIIKLNNELKKNQAATSSQPLEIVVLSNIIVHYFQNVLEYVLRLRKEDPSVYFGDYDNILQNTTDNTTDKAQCVIIFWELANLLEGLHYKIDTMSEADIAALTFKVKNEIGLALKNLAAKPLVIFNTFSSTPFSSHNLRASKLDRLAAELNEYVAMTKPSNVQIVNLEQIFAQISIRASVNFRDYYSSKSLYTVPFFKAYAEQITPLFTSMQGKAKKALIFDCDNTLWQGILGEDGFEGIKMTAQNKATAYEEVQYLAKGLSAKGVIIGLCSKNNFADVEQVVTMHPDFKLTNDEITIKAINWQDKVSNLKQIAEDLNIGLDSLVFVDDSDFEVNLIREQLPQVEVIQVPTKAIYSYPSLIRQAFSLFYNLSETQEDLAKTRLYKKEIARKEEAQRFDNIEDYLKSLDLQLDIFINDTSLVPRLAQLTQKTNQFNLTTKRYTEQDILNFIENGASVVAFSVKDRFGDSGITGLAILTYENEDAHIDSLLMSCRVLGRNAEYKFFDTIAAIAHQHNAKILTSKYVKTPKNAQVKDLYDRLGFNILRGSEEATFYRIETAKYQSKSLDYIKLVINEGRS